MKLEIQETEGRQNPAADLVIHIKSQEKQVSFDIIFKIKNLAILIQIMGLF